MSVEKERDLDELEKNYNKFIEVIYAQFILANKYVKDGGRNEMWQVKKLMDSFNAWLRTKIEERYK